MSSLRGAVHVHYIHIGFLSEHDLDSIQSIRLALKIRITYSETDLSASLMVENHLFGLPPGILIALSSFDPSSCSLESFHFCSILSKPRF